MPISTSQLARMTEDPFKKTSRRQFLRGKSALDELRDKLPEPGLTHAEQSNFGGNHAEQSKNDQLRRQASHLQHFSKPAMGCTFQFLFNATQYPHAAEIVREAFELIDELESEMSIYRSASKVSELNRAPAGTDIKVSAGLFECFQIAMEISEVTEGAFDISSGPLTEVWGFENRSPRVPSRDTIDGALAKVGFKQIELNQSDKSVRLRRDSMKVNFGGLGKGYALDRCADVLEAAGINDFVIHGGNSSVLARGARTTSDISRDSKSDSGWVVGLSHPIHADKRFDDIRLCNQSLGTSGSARQALFHRGQRLSHIIDPRSGWPASEVLSATVIGTSAAWSDALATAVCVLGAESAHRLADQLQLHMILVLENDEVIMVGDVGG